MFLKLTREIQAFTFLEAFLHPVHAQHMHSSVNLCFTGRPQCQHLSDLSCIPWSPLKSVLGTTTMWISCAGARALFWDIPNPILTLHLHEDHPHELLSSLALHWVKHHGQPRPWGQGRNLLCTTSTWRFKRVERQGVCIVALGHSDQWHWQKSFHQVCRRNILVSCCFVLQAAFIPSSFSFRGRAMVILSLMMLSCETSARPELRRRILIEMENQRARNSNNSSHSSPRCAPLLHASVASPPPEAVRDTRRCKVSK